MATKAKKKSRGKSGSKAAVKKGGAKRRSAAKRPAKKGSAKKAPAKRGKPARKSAAKGASPKKKRNPFTRVTRVAKEVAQQATTAVTEGVETLKEFGESIVERVSG